jgi:peptidoglycan/LPS O-acetylase OafA/YrhL
MVWIFSRKNLIRLCLFLFVASYIFRNIGLNLGFVIPFPYVATLGRMEPIVLGALIALLVRSNKSILEKITPYVLLVFGLLSIVSFIYAGSFHMDQPVNYRFTYTLIDLFFAGMITLTLSSNLPMMLRRIFRNPFIIKVGVMSYGLYIFHNIIFSLVEHNYKSSFVHLTGSEILGHAVVVICALFVTIPVCYTIHKYIEVPLWKFKRYF